MSKARVIEFKPLEEDGFRFIPYCDFPRHRGIIKNRAVCERRDCRYYYKLDIPFYREDNNAGADNRD